MGGTYLQTLDVRKEIIDGGFVVFQNETLLLFGVECQNLFQFVAFLRHILSRINNLLCRFCRVISKYRNKRKHTNFLIKIKIKLEYLAVSLPNLQWYLSNDSQIW